MFFCPTIFLLKMKQNNLRRKIFFKQNFYVFCSTIFLLKMKQNNLRIKIFSSKTSMFFAPLFLLKMKQNNLRIKIFFQAKLLCFLLHYFLLKMKQNNLRIKIFSSKTQISLRKKYNQEPIWTPGIMKCDKSAILLCKIPRYFERVSLPGSEKLFERDILSSDCVTNCEIEEIWVFPD